jgi:glucosamine 6-phosphate synthetase-like amidotransferase/phosphosugar isomerase protein
MNIEVGEDEEENFIGSDIPANLKYRGDATQVMAVTNVIGSSISREADDVLFPCWVRKLR